MDRDRSSPSADERPQKRQRVLACRRCRGRKQKCEDKRPCSNCIKSGDDCVATEPAPRPHVETEYVKALEERIAELEAHDPRQSQDHMPPLGNDHIMDARPRRLTHSSLGTQSANGRHTIHHVTGAQRDNTLARRPSEAVDNPILRETASVSPANMSVARRSYSQQSPGGTLSLADDSDSGLDHLMMGLIASPSTHPHDGISAFPGKSPIFPVQNATRDGEFLPQTLITAMPAEVEDLLLNAYRGRAQAQYPFLHWGTFLTWLSDWKYCPPSEIASRSWQGFFVNLVYSTALLLLALPRVGQSDARTFYRNGISLLPAVYEKQDDILSMQSYLLLSMHALHKSSTPRVLSLASLTIRYCVQLQFHLYETEPEPIDHEARLKIQVRRRCFWSAYCVDRLVMASFELPPSISDVMITAKLYANIDDEDLAKVALEASGGGELPDSPVYTCVSSSLHILQCRRIQSEISGYTLRWDYKEHYESSLEWRIRILAELENYKSRVQNFTDPQAKGHTSQRWLAMIYHYTLLTLYRPTKESVLGPAGDWSIQASSQACLMFRKSQMDRQIAQAWLGLLVQFQSGVTLLYCCWATPPEYRTENYDSPDVSDALRACSNILAIMADRWPKADCLRDVFELLAREVPLVDRPSRPPIRIADSSIEAIREKLPQVRALVVHRSIMRMIEEMITDDFPRLRDDQSPPTISRRVTPGPPRERPASILGSRQISNASPAVGVFELPFGAQQMYDSVNLDTGSLNPDELLAFPGMFDLNSWT